MNTPASSYLGANKVVEFVAKYLAAPTKVIVRRLLVERQSCFTCTKHSEPVRWVSARCTG